MNHFFRIKLVLTSRLRRAVFSVLFFAPLLLSFRLAAAQNAATSDVVIVVDTATRLQQPDVDLRRASWLATMLLADVVPGRLAVARPLDVAKDQSVIPSQRPDQIEKCTSNPAVECRRVIPANDWYGNARARKFGVLVRASRNDSSFKEQLNRHLEPVNSSSMLGLALRGAQGEFDSLGSNQERMVVWFGAGDGDDPDQVRAAAADLERSGAVIKEVTFGETAAPLPVSPSFVSRQVRSASEVMKVSAGIFRQIVQAPHEVDNIVSVHPSFEMKPGVDEVWVIVYGDDSLEQVTVETPDGPQPANYARGQQTGVGAYRVFHGEKPVPGQWSVRVELGGAAAYSVIERSSVLPVVLEPRTAPAGIPVLLVAKLEADADNPLFGCQEEPDGILLEADIRGQKIQLVDDGTHGDKVARDGLCSATVTFDEVGEIPFTVRARSDLLDRSVRASVTVTGMFRIIAGKSVDLDLGTFKAPGQSCREFRIAAEQQGVLSFEIAPTRDLPPGYQLELHQTRGVFVTGQRMPMGPGEPLKLCLVARSSAPSFTGKGEHWLDLKLAGSTSPDSIAPIQVHWVLRGLTWWQRQRRTMLALAGLVVFLLIGYGYVHPRRFARNLAITFVSQRQEMDQQTPQTVTRSAGTGVGWYRDARAYLHHDFRMNGKSAGALAVLIAAASGTQVQSGEESTLYRETIEGNWEPLPAQGRRAGGGEVYRIGETGPFFRISVRH